jgi:hypothetical protein
MDIFTYLGTYWSFFDTICQLGGLWGEDTRLR